MTNNPPIYLDNAAAAYVSSEDAGLFAEIAQHAFANQEASHGLAHALRTKIAEAEKILAQSLTGSRDNAAVQWGDSGTSLIAALFRLPRFRAGNILTTGLEHPALNAAIDRTGAAKRIVRTPGGKIDIRHFEELLDDATVLVAVHHVQSETGIIQDLCGLRQVTDRKAPDALFLADTIQSAGKIPLPWQDAKLDFALVSGHKLGVPGGSALLYRDRKEAGIISFSRFFKQQRHDEYLSGRPDPAAILTLSEIVSRRVAEFPENIAAAAHLNQLLRRELGSISLPGNRKIIFTASPQSASPYILHVIVPGFQGAVLVRMLSAKNIFIASGSACSAESGEPGKTLPAMGFSREDAYSALRISFWRQNTGEDIKAFAAALNEALEEY